VVSLFRSAISDGTQKPVSRRETNRRKTVGIVSLRNDNNVMGKCLSRNAEGIEDKYQQSKSEAAHAEVWVDPSRSIPEVKTNHNKRIHLQVNENSCHDLVIYSPPKSKPDTRIKKVEEKPGNANNKPIISPLNLSSVISDDTDVSDVYESVTVVLASTEQSRYTENKQDSPVIIDSKELNSKRMEWNNRYLMSAVVPRKEQENNAYYKYMRSSLTQPEDSTSKNTEKASNRENESPLKDDNANKIQMVVSSANKNQYINYNANHATGTFNKQTILQNGNDELEKITPIEVRNSTYAKKDVMRKKENLVDDIVGVKSSQKDAIVDSERAASLLHTSQNQSTRLNMNDEKPPIGHSIKQEKDFSLQTNKPSYLRTIENANDAITRLRSTEFRSTSAKRASIREEPNPPVAVPQVTHENNKSFHRVSKKPDLVLDIRHDDSTNRSSLPTTTQKLNPEPNVYKKPSGHMDTRLNIRTSQSMTSNYSTVRQATDAIARLRSVSRGRTHYWESSICSDLSETFSWNEEPKDGMMSYLERHQEAREDEEEDKENSPRKTPFSPDHSSIYTMSTLSFTITK